MLNAAPTFTGGTLTAAAQVGKAFSYPLSAGGPVFSYSAENLPAGLSLNPLTGYITGVPQVAGTVSVSIGASNDGGTGSTKLLLSTQVAAPLITGTLSVTTGVGLSFRYQITTDASPTSYQVSELPNGFSFDSKTGLLTGTPTAAAVLRLTVGATNEGGTTNAPLSITVGNPAPSFPSDLSVNAVLGQPFSYQLFAEGSPTSYTASGLPIGFSLNERTGLISSGSLAVNFLGGVRVLVGASNAMGSGSGTLTLIGKKAVPEVSSTLAATATLGVPFSYQINATNAPTGFTAKGLPDGLSLDAASGLIAGVPSLTGQTGAVPVTLGAINDGGTGSALLALTVLPPLPLITSSLLETATAGKFYSYTVSASGSPTEYGVSGLLSGLSFDAATATLSGVLSGTAASSTPYAVVLKATNASGSAQATMFLTVSPAAVTLSPFTAALAVNAGDPVQTLNLDGYLGSSQTGTLKRSWSFSAGQEAVPSWIQLSAAGTLSVLPPLNQPTTAKVLQVTGVNTSASTVTTVSGTLTLNVTAAQPPVSNLPVVQTEPGKVELNTTVTLTVSGSLGADVTYQWRKDGVRIVGGTAASLPVLVDSPDKLGLYDVVLTNRVGSSFSQALLVEASGTPLKLGSSLQPLTLVKGQTSYTWSDFSVVNATGSTLPSTVTYRWELANGGTLSQTGASFVFSGALVAGSYKVTAKAGFNEVSSEALVRVFDPVTFTSALTSPGQVIPGKPFELAVTAAGGDPAVAGGSLRYQWFREGVAIQGATKPAFTVPGLLPEDDNKVEYSVRAFVRDEAGKELNRALSATGKIRVRQPLSAVAVTSSGASVQTESVPLGAFLNLSAVVRVGTALASSAELDGISYQWRKDGIEIGGATDFNLNFNAAETSSGSYDVVATSAVNSVTSPGLILAVNLPPSLVTQPVSKTVSRLSNVKFSVDAKGTAPLVYRWSKDGVPLTDGSLVAGAATAALTLSLVDLQSEGEYTVQVSNGLGSAQSSAATLAVTNAVQITTQPTNLTKAVGDKAEFSVVAAGNGLRYQWRRGGKNIVGATLPSLALTGVSATDAAEYDVVILSGSVEVVSQVARLEVLLPASIVSEPVGSLAVLPDPKGNGLTYYTLNVGVAGSGTFSYQWYRNGVAVQGGTQAALQATLRETDPNNAQADYHVVVSNTAQIGADIRVLGSATSKVATVAFLPPVEIAVSSQPKDVTVDAGAQARLSVANTGGGTVSYKWERLLAGRWNEVLGASSSSLLLTDLLPSDSSAFRVKVTNARNTVTSAQAMITVREAEVITSQPSFAAVNPGDTAVCEVVAVKAKNPTYQWFKNNVAVAGAQSAVLKVGAVSAGDAGVYHVVVTHAFGASTSQATRLTVREPVTITAQPVAPPLVEGGDATLVVKATGTPDLKYIWRKGGVEIPDARNSDSYTITGATSLDSGIYDVLISNPVGSVASRAVNISVLTGVVITAAPKSQVVEPGAGLLLSVAATGSPKTGTEALVYQWRKYNAAGVPEPLQKQAGLLTGADSDTLLIASADPGSLTTEGSSGKYDVVVSNDVNAATSLPAEITVKSPPFILKQPVSQVVNPDDSVRFTVDVKGTPDLTYAWYRKQAGEADPGTLVGTLRELTIANAKSAIDAGTYKVVVSNAVLWKGVLQPATSQEAQLGFVEALTLPDEDTVEVVGSGALKSTVSAKPVSAKLGSTVEIPFLVQIPSQQGVSIVYQWRKDGVPLVDLPGTRSGVSTPKLTLLSVTSQDAGSYDLVISKVSAGAEKSRILSRTTLLTVQQPPVITGLTDTLGRPGQKVTFSPVVTSSGTAALSYEWYRGTVPISGATSRTLQVDAIAGSYALEATDDNGTSRATAVLSVADVLSVEALPPSLRVDLRSRVTFEAKTTGSAADGVLRYQWRFNGTAIRGAVRAKFELPAASLSHAGKYDVLVSNNYERIASGACVLQVNEPFRIVTQPVANTTVNPGEPIRLNVVLNRTEGATFQWIRGIGRASTVLPGQTSPTLFIPEAFGAETKVLNPREPNKEASAGVYVLVVKTPAGRITSNLARVNVNLPVTIVQSPASPPNLKPGDSLTLVVKASGTGPLVYQWLRNGVPVVGANSSTLSLGAVTAADAGQYQASITNVVSTKPVLSEVATVTVTLPPVITEEPKDLALNQWAAKAPSGVEAPKTHEESVRQGSTLVLTVGASKDPAPSAVLGYQWRRNGVPIAGGTQATLTRDFLSAADTGLYDVVVTEKLGATTVGTAVSRQASVLVHELPVFIVPPVPQAVALGGFASFRSLAAGTPPLRYAWTKAGSSAVLGASGSLTFSSVSPATYGEYTLTVTGPTGKSTAATVALTETTVSLETAFAVQPAPVVGIEKKPLRLLATAGPGFKIERWERLVTSGGSSNAQALSDVQSGGSLYLAAPVYGDSGPYRAVSVRQSEPREAVASEWVSLYVNLDDPLYVPGFRVNTGSVSALKNEQVFSAVEGGSATLRMFPVGEGLSYEWRKDGAVGILANSNKTAITLRGLKKEDAGLYFGTVLIPDGSGGVERRDSIEFRLIVQPLPVIGKDPVSQFLLPGQTAVFSIETEVTPDSRFQWFFRPAAATEWVPVPGATLGAGTLSTCYVKDVREVDEGFYRVEVTNGAGTVSSGSAYLTVRNPVQVRLATSPVVDSTGVVSLDPGSALKLTADIGTAVAADELAGDATNLPVYVFRKQQRSSRRYEILQSGTSNVYAKANVQESDDTFYTVTVEGKVNGQVTSAPVRVDVHDPVSFGANPLRNVTLVKGETATLKVVANGYNPQVQWYRRSDSTAAWAPLPGATASSYVIASAALEDAGSYGVVLQNTVRDAKGELVTAPADGTKKEIARVSVKAPPSAVILLAATSLQVGQGGSISLSADVSDAAGGLVQYQWRKDGRLIAGGTGGSGSTIVLSSSAPRRLTFEKTNVSSADAGQYELLVSNANGASLSAAPRYVAVAALPSITLLSRPEAAAASANGTATFRVAATATGTIFYQWQRLQGGLSAAVEGNWENVGMDSPVYSVKGVSAAESATALGDDQSRYRVVLSIPSAGFTLEEKPWAELRVSNPKDVKISDKPILVGGGSELSVGSLSAQLRAVAQETAGAGTLYYQWRKDGVAIADTRSKTTGKAKGSVVRGPGPDGVFLITYDLPPVDNNSDGVYDLLVDNGANFASSEALVLTVNPKILSLEVPATVNPGDSAKLEVKVSGTGYTYEWRRNGQKLANVTNSISGADSPVLLLSAVTEANSGTYSVVVTRAGLSSPSAALPLVVAAKVSITGQPSLVGDLKTGQTLTLNVQAGGGGTVLYQWFKDGLALSSGTSATLRVPNVTLDHAGLYQVRVSNASSSEMSSLVAVKVQQPLSVTLPPSLDVNLGQSANLVPTVLGSGSLSYRWLLNGRELSGATSEQYRISPATVADGGSYTLKVTSAQTDASSETVASAPLVVRVKLLPQIVVPPASLTVGGAVSTASFAVVVRSTLPVTYTWTRDGVQVPGNFPFLNLTNLVPASAPSLIKVTVENTEGSVSATARLTVGANPPEVHNAGSADVSQVYANASWWVFWADALGKTQGDDYTPGSTRSGYWLIERLSTGTGASLVVTPGRSLWVWGDSEKPSDSAVSDIWLAAQQTVQDALDSESAEFSVLGQRSDSDYALSGRVEPSGEAALYGAPAVMDGAYKTAIFGRLDLSLVWDGDQVLYFDGNSDIDAVTSQLETVLAGELAKIKGE